MDYLKQYAVASAPALFVISRYLATRPSGASEGELQKILQAPALSEHRDAARRGDGPPAVLPASLQVGKDLELLEAQGDRGGPRLWSLRDSLRDEVQAGPSADSRPFRSLLLRRLGARAIAAIEAHDRPSDVALALTWLLLRDPLAPFPAAWGDGPEMAIQDAGLGTAVDSPEQWRALVRWARSLGLMTVTAAKQGRVLVVDPTNAIRDALGNLPRRAPAEQWFRRLRSLLPVLGDQKIVSKLPAGTAPIPEVSASTSLAVQKLEWAGRLRLVPSDDASNAAVLRIGGQDRRIGEVHVGKEVAA